jgi:glycosyltransferase involved in cell wall biosynthesis
VSRLHLFWWLRSHDIEIVLFNEEHDIGVVRDVAKAGCACGAYVDYYTHDTVADFDAYDFLVCNTRRHYSVFKDHRNCLYVPWGTDPMLFRPTVSRPLSPDQTVFFHSAGMGGISLRKGTDFVVRAFQKVRGKVRLIVHSQVPLSDYGGIQALVAADSRIEFIHKTVSAPGLYHLADVYVYPSRLEGIGLSVPEALASGLPVVTTDEPPMSEFVRDGYNGRLVKVAQRKNRSDGYYWPESLVDVDDLTAKMQTYADDPLLIAEHSVHAREAATTELDWQKNGAFLAEWMARFAGRGCRRVDCRTLSRWCLFDLFLVAQGGAAKAVRESVHSPRVRGMLKRLLWFQTSPKKRPRHSVDCR